MSDGKQWQCARRAVLAELTISGLLHLDKEAAQEYGPSFKQLALRVQARSPHILRISITDSQAARWRIPAALIPGIYDKPDANMTAADLQYSSSVGVDPFFIGVRRASQGTHDAGASKADVTVDKQQVKESMGATGQSCAPLHMAGSCMESAAGGEAPLLFQLNTFAFKDQYLEVSTPVPASSRLMGLGEQTRTSGALMPS